MGLLVPPRVALSWSATALGSSFYAYRVYRRPARGAAAAWTLIAELGVPAGYTAATVEAQHTQFFDYEAGWANTAGGQWADGWDYGVCVVDATTLSESVKTLDTLNVATYDQNPWLVCNPAPYLNHPLARVKAFDAQDRDTLTAYPVAGRDLQVTRARLELPGREYRVGWDDFGGPTLGNLVGEDTLRLWRGAAASGRKVCVHRPLGDRCIGAVSPITGASDRESMLYLDVQGRLIETARDTSDVSGHNLPAGLVLNGSSQYATTPTNTLLNPSGSAFTVFCAAVFPTASGKYHVTKGNIGVASAYGLLNSGASTMQFFVNGSGGNATATAADATTYDGSLHAIVGTSTGAAQTLYRDGTQIATGASAHGTVTNAIALVAGANNGGAASWSALAPLHAWGVYLRALTPAEAKALSYYLLGYPGWRAPAGPVVFFDLRDDRTWLGTGTALADLSGNGLTATATAAPPTRGIPWPLSDVDRF